MVNKSGEYVMACPNFIVIFGGANIYKCVGVSTHKLLS